ncbi:N-acetyltransferase family protein [Nocardioides sp. MH1]|uniref:GNAT family N-acetyltransferase n=1 Tax=Nocardioides sp. MH1 TaxID=3242490 RepID=UPI0035214E66
MLIRPAAVSDAEALTDLHLDVWEEAYGHLITEDILQERRQSRSERVVRWSQNIPRPESETLLAWDDADGRLLGFVSTGPRRDEEEPELPDLEVWALYARADVYGRGVGHALLTEAIETAAAYLWVLDGNDRAIAFYERQGFRFDGASKTEPVGVGRRMVRR